MFPCAIADLLVFVLAAAYVPEGVVARRRAIAVRNPDCWLDHRFGAVFEEAGSTPPTLLIARY
jgi:hypothetical protein